MVANSRKTRARRRQPQEQASAPQGHGCYLRERGVGSAPIVVAIEPRTAHATADIGARLARELGAPLVFVTVRPRPSTALDSPSYQRRPTRDLFGSRKALDTALTAAGRHGAMSYGEILEGDAATEIVKFARARNVRLLIVGAGGHPRLLTA